MLTSSPFFASRAAAALINDTLQSAHIIRIATAYFEPSGYQVLQDALADKHVLLLIGREEGGRDRLEAVLDDFVNQFLARPLERRTEAMRKLLLALEAGRLFVAVGAASDPSVGTFLDARYLYQHAKVYIADGDAAVVTSANLSFHGLVNSIEAGIRISDPVDVRYFVERFDEYFARAESITDALIERLRQLLALYPPYYVYARALLELYELPDDEVPAQLPPLSDYQRPVVSRTLQAIRTFRGAMMIASTGLGKTVMAAHIAAYLRMHNEIDRVLVICPAGLRENWRRFMRMARMSSIEFSYSTFSLNDPSKYASLRQLLYELRYTDPKTLVLIDESHHLRNPQESAKRQKDRYKRVRDAVHKRGACALLLTATPYSRGIKDVNAQLALLPHSEYAAKDALLKEPAAWKVSQPAELPNLPPCPTLTTPTVVKQFSQPDNAGHRFVEFAQGGRRYFPHRIQLRSVVFPNPLDPVLIELLSGSLLNVSKSVAANGNFDTMQMNFGDDWDADVTGKGSGLIKAEIMKQFCSSPAQIDETMRKLSRAGGFEKTEFVDQSRLADFVASKAGELKSACESDAKLRALIGIIRATTEKVVVFCHYRATASYLHKRLSEAGIQTNVTVNKNGEQLDTLLRSFAPIANEVEPESIAQDSPQVLVVTNALAEGFNLQDAAILVNYDLPWTVLMLAQRMGRVLRPWKEPREITIYNFIPEAMSNPDLQIAMRWHERLQARSADHQALADIPVMQSNGQHTDEAYEMAALAQNLAHNREEALDLDQVLDFIEQAEAFETSGFFTDLLKIKPLDRDKISALYPGFRSAKRYKGPSQLFLLMRYHKRQYPVLFDREGNIKIDFEQPDQIMQHIRCEPSEPISSMFPDDGDFDRWIESARLSWCASHGYREDDIRIICALALMERL